VRTGVTNDLQTFFILRGDDGELRIMLNQIGSINQLTVNTASNSGFRQTGPMSSATSMGLTWS
jgi:hypothetical protein